MVPLMLSIEGALSHLSLTVTYCNTSNQKYFLFSLDMECLYLQPILRPETHRQTKLRPVWGRRLHSVDGTKQSGDTMSKLKTDQDCNFWLRWPAPGDQFGE